MKTIPSFPNYAITKDGRVWSKSRKKANRFASGQRINSRNHIGYRVVNLWRDGKRFTQFVHRLVLETFVGPCPENMVCRHLDGNRANNNLENLCWGTPRENGKDSVRYGTCFFLKCRADNRGEKHYRTKLTDEKVKIIRYLKNVAKFSISDLMWQFDSSRACIEKICRGESWKHLLVSTE